MGLGLEQTHEVHISRVRLVIWVRFDISHIVAIGGPGHKQLQCDVDDI